MTVPQGWDTRRQSNLPEARAVEYERLGVVRASGVPGHASTPPDRVE